VAALSRNDFNASPAVMLQVVNAVLYDNVRNRLAQDEHATLTLIRYFANGELVFAGAHEDLVVLRAATGRCECIPTLGTWVGATEDIAAATEEQRARLEEGDVLLLYTDGVIEAANAAREQYGIERLIAELEAAGSESVTVIRDRLLGSVQRFLAVQDDDIALLVARYKKAEA
jgi:phosphoserine phosphatase RsbU/P